MKRSGLIVAFIDILENCLEEEVDDEEKEQEER